MNELEAQESSDVEAPSNLAKELGIIKSESKILIAGSEEYTRAEQQKMKEIDPVTRVVEHRFRDDAEREVVLLGTEHIFDPDHPEAHYLKGIIDVIPEDSHKVLILEGQYQDGTEPIADPQEAIKMGGGEFNYLRSLAVQRGIEVIPGEPDPHESAQKILAERPDITRDEVALHYALKVLVGVLPYDNAASAEDVSLYIHHAVGIAGDAGEGGWVQKSTSRNEVMNARESQKVQAVSEMPTIVSKLNIEFAKVYPGETLLDLQPDGSMSLKYDLSKQPVPWDPSLGTKMSEISSLDMLMRDRRTFELTMKALEEGKEPIIAVGNSHVSTLKPALEAQLQAA